MKSCIWLTMLLSALLVLSACQKEKETEVPTRQTETAPPPAQKEMKTPAESTPPMPGETSKPEVGQKEIVDNYTTPKEGEREGMQNLEVVDKNMSEAMNQPSTIGPPENSGPETVILEAKNGNVTFHHREHQERTDCSSCHQQTPPEKIELNMESAHKLCRGCHQANGAGPVKCAECHKKG